MSEPIRVLHIVQRMEAAGVQNLLMNIYRNIDRNKVQFDFLVHYKAPQFFDEEIEKMGGKIYRLSVREDYNFIKYKKDLRKFFKNHNEYKIVHGHMNTLGAIYLKEAKKNNVPVRIAHSHTNSAQNDAKKILKIFMNKKFSKYATDLFACSTDAGKYMFGDKEFTIIPNAIDSSKFIFDVEIRKKKRSELGVENNFVIGCVGRFAIAKNQKFSLRVFEEYLKIDENSILLFIGSGSMENEIKNMVNEKNLEKKVIFLGNRYDVNELYQAMDVFLFPSLFEGLGIVGVEAQATGTPVVCTDTLPKEINITPLINRVSLDKSPNFWASEIKKASQAELKHSNMASYIEKANYDIKELSKKLVDFYIKMNGK